MVLHNFRISEFQNKIRRDQGRRSETNPLFTMAVAISFNLDDGFRE